MRLGKPKKCHIKNFILQRRSFSSNTDFIKDGLIIAANLASDGVGQHVCEAHTVVRRCSLKASLLIIHRKGDSRQLYMPAIILELYKIERYAKIIKVRLVKK